MPWGPIGHVDEVNGPGAGLVRGFVPTKYEVLELARHWVEIQIDLEYFCWCYETSGSDWSRRMAFAGMRLNRIAECIAQDEFQRVYDKAIKDFGEKQNPELWSKFLKGEPAPPITEEDMEKGWWGWVEEGLENLLLELLHLSDVTKVNQDSLVVFQPLRKDLLELLEQIKKSGDMKRFWNWDSPTALRELISKALPGPGGLNLRKLLAEAMPPRPNGLFHLLHNDIRKALDERPV
jgi:hypothetical protein